MANIITKEEHERNRRRRMRQMLGLGIFILVLIGALNVLAFAVNGVASLFDDSEKRMEYGDRLQTLVMLDPLPFASLDQMDDSTARLIKESAIWSAMYSAQRAGSLDHYERDPDTDALIMPAVEVDAAVAALYGPNYKITHGSFEGVDMNYQYSEEKQGYFIPVTGQMGLYNPDVISLKKKDGKLYVTVGYIPTAAITGDYSLTTPSDPSKYMDYVFEKQGKEYYLVALQTSDIKPVSSTATTSTVNDSEFDPTSMMASSEETSQPQSTAEQTDETANG